MPNPKRATWTVYAENGEPATNWTDAPDPTFGVRSDGPEGVRIVLPFQHGVANQALARGVAWGRRIDLHIATDESQVRTAGPARLGRAPFFTVPLEGSSLAPLVYSGRIVAWTEDVAARLLTVEILPRSRGLDLTYLPRGRMASGTPAQIARELVEEFGGDLVWDARNPLLVAGQIPTTVEFGPDSLRTALQKMRDLAGPNWLAFGTPTGTVRFFEPDVTAPPDHTLVDGVSATGTRLFTDGTARRTRVRVLWAGGAAPDLAAVTDGQGGPATEQVAADHLTSEGDALRLAKQQLERLDRNQERGETTVLPSYPLETIEVGHTAVVQVATPLSGQELLRLDRTPLREGGLGPARGARPLVIHEVQYSTANVRLVFSRPSTWEVAQIAETKRGLAGVQAAIV